MYFLKQKLVSAFKAGVQWVARYPLTAWALKPFMFVGTFALNELGAVVTYQEFKSRKKIFDLIQSVRRETSMIMSNNEAFNLYQMVRGTEGLGGALAEVGVYRGGTAKVICEANQKRPLHLFDTFEGLPEVGEVDSGNFKLGQFKSSLDFVKDFLKAYDGVTFHPGMFPQSTEGIEEHAFSFVHLDVDTYRSTLACLKYFYPRLLPAGMLITHDFASTEGVPKAFAEFFAGKKEVVIETEGNQGYIVKQP